MKIDKLIIKDGIIMNDFIGGIPVYTRIIEGVGKGNVRTYIKMTDRRGLTIHDTDNTARSAGDEMHAKHFTNIERDDTQFLGVPILIDHDSITQILPIDEVAYHAGTPEGNYHSVGVETCVNAYIKAAQWNTQLFAAAWLLTFPDDKLFKHQDWNGKLCPKQLLTEANGWENFTARIHNLVDINTATDDFAEYYREGWEKAIYAGIEDGLNPNEQVTAVKLMAYFNKIGLTDEILKQKGLVWPPESK